LYLDPPQNAAVRIPLAWNALAVCIPNPKTGEVFGHTAPRHTSQEFVDFLEEVVDTQPAQREVHVILDNFQRTKPTS
jgi:hypothetical protein